MSFKDYIKETAEDNSHKAFMNINSNREGKPVMLTTKQELKNSTVLSCANHVLTYVTVERGIATIEQISPTKEILLRLDANKLKNNIKHI